MNCFDNLALDQLNMHRFFDQESWNEFCQGEHSMYIDAANQVFKPSSRSSESTPWDISIYDYYNGVKN